VLLMIGGFLRMSREEGPWAVSLTGGGEVEADAVLPWLNPRLQTRGVALRQSGEVVTGDVDAVRPLVVTERPKAWGWARPGRAAT